MHVFIYNLAVNLHVHTKWLLQSKNHEYLLYKAEGGITGWLSFICVFLYDHYIRTSLQIYPNMSKCVYIYVIYSSTANRDLTLLSNLFWQKENLNCSPIVGCQNSFNRQSMWQFLYPIQCQSLQYSAFNELFCSVLCGPFSCYSQMSVI